MGPMDGVPQFSEVHYADLSVGDRWGPFVERLAQRTSDGLRGAIGTHAEGTSAPLGVLPLLTLRVLRRALNGIIPGGVLARQHFSAIDALPAEGEVAIEMWVSAQQRRPSGLYTTFTFSFAYDERVPAIVEWMIIAPPEEDEPPEASTSSSSSDGRAR
ncbi:MAG: hypothetical protein JWQ48_2578 [Conexibacter sp.]|nr:hypothetical protein [Conexibacter sp.]